MRPSPTKLLHGLLYTAPVLLLTLAACGGGGGGGTDVTLAAAYTVGGAASGVLATTPASGLVLRNNGGDDLTVASGVTSYKFSTSVISGKPYNVTVLKNPSSPVQKCEVVNGSGTMPAYNVTNANVSCVTAYTIGGTITGDAPSAGLVLQNNGGDNLLIASGVTGFTFSTPLAYDATGSAYDVTVLTSPLGQTCSPAAFPSGSVTANVSNVTVDCVNNVGVLPADPNVYVANSGSTGTIGVSVYRSATGVLTAGADKTSGSGPSAIEVDPAGQTAYVANYNDDTISAYSINGTTGALNILTDVDVGTPGNQASIAAGNGPRSIAIHPSGKFAYVTNFLANSVSAYSIDSGGALASIDANGGTAGTQASITTRSNPVSIAIDPSGEHAYVANAGSNDVSVYSIDSLTGALTAIKASSTGTDTFIPTGNLTSTPRSIKVGPNDQYLYVTNQGTANVSIFAINSVGQLANATVQPVDDFSAITPVSIAIDPAAKYVYVVNYGSDNVNVYQTTGGGLLYKWQTAAGEVGDKPTSIRLDSTGQYAYVTNSGSNSVSVFSVNSSSGALNHISCIGSTCISNNFPAGATPFAVATSR